MRMIEIDITNIQTVKALHIYLAWKLDMPAHYGRNLDALYDVLGECGAEMNILLRGEPAGEEMAAYLPRLEGVLGDCADEGIIRGYARK